MPVFAQELAQLLAERVHVDPLDVEARRHDRPDALIAHAEHPLHEALFVLFERAALGTLADHGANFVFGEMRLGVALDAEDA